MSSFSTHGESKTKTAEYHHGLGEFYLLSIGMDNWTKDATMISDLFKGKLKYRENKIYLLNQNDGPTKDEVIDVFESKLIPKITEKDTLVIYYSGHGGRGTKDDEEFRFCTKGAYLYCSEFKALVKRIRTKRVLLVIDACFAGAMPALKSKDKSTDSFDAGDLQAFLKSTGKVIMTSASSSLLSPGTSAFSHAFDECVRSAVDAKDGKIMEVSPFSIFAEVDKTMKKSGKQDPLPRFTADETANFEIGPILPPTESWPLSSVSRSSFFFLFFFNF